MVALDYVTPLTKNEECWRKTTRQLQRSEPTELVFPSRRTWVISFSERWCEFLLGIKIERFVAQLLFDNAHKLLFRDDEKKSTLVQ